MIEYYKNDPLYYRGKFKLGTAFSINELLKLSSDIKDNVSTPIFIVQGMKDSNVCSDGNIKYINDCSVLDKVIITDDDLEHDVLHDNKVNKYLEDIITWMEEK